MIYVCSVWRLSKSSMPVIYQHIFAILVTILHNLSSPHTTFSGWAPHLNPFRCKLVIKPYHITALKGASIPLKNAPKSPNFRPFATINFKINFGHDRSWIYREQVSTVTLPSSGWSCKVTGAVRGRASRSEGRGRASRELMPQRSSTVEPSSMYEIINNISKKVWGSKAEAAKLRGWGWGRDLGQGQGRGHSGGP